jgi:hypothetical protein
MKIAILTQPLETNYGGLLQAFALQKVLKRMGHEVLTINMRFGNLSCKIKVISILKRLAIRLFTNKPMIIRAWPTAKEKNIISSNTNQFIRNNIDTTQRIHSAVKYNLVKKYRFEAYIVGSDQIWRPLYSPNLTNYFLDFVEKKENIKRIAYAASFGVNKWEFSDKQTTQCASLARRFNAISVREDSAVNLCKLHLGVDAIQVLDPTMLLTKEDYMELVVKDRIPKSKGTLMTYILDKAGWKNELIHQMADKVKLTPFSVMPNEAFSKAGKKHLEECIFPPVTEWIRGFMDAEFVITDSFHGTVFAILFNKQFLCLGNNDRGLTRMTSLLDKMELADRLICEEDKNKKLHELKAIDYQKVNQIIEREKIKSMDFLENALSQNN